MISDTHNNINALDEKGLTQLHYAADKGDLTEVQRLHQEGADLNARGPDGVRAIHLACTKRQVEVLQYLVCNGATLIYNDLAEDLETQFFESIRYLPPETLALLSKVQNTDTSVLGDNDHTG